MNIGTLTAILGVDITGLGRATQAMQQYEKTTTNSLNRMAQRVRTFGYLASSVLTLPMVLAGKASLQAAKEFEFSMAKIVGLVGISRSQVEDWSKEIIAMSTQVAKSPQELAEALYYVTSAGFKTTQALDILRISAKAATAGLGETTDVANMITSAMNAYRSSGLTAARTADVLVAAVREGKIEASGFATAMQQVLPIASALKIPIDQVAGAMASMSLQGASAANSAVYLKGIMNSIMKIRPSNQAGKALAELGSSGMALQKALGEQGLMPVLLQIQAWSKTNPQLLRKVFGDIRGLTGDLSLVGDNLQYNQTVMESVKNAAGDLNKAYAAVSDTIKVRFDTAMASLKGGMITFGKILANELLPVLDKLVGKFTTWVEKLSNMDEGTQKMIIRTLAFVAALGPLSLLISALMYGLSGIISLVTKLTGIFSVLQAVVMKNPWVLAVAGIVAAGTWIVHYKKKMEDATIAQSDFNKQLVEVNGNIKKLKELTSTDFSAMSMDELFSVRLQASAQMENARKMINEYQKLAGVSDKDAAAGASFGKWNRITKLTYAEYNKAKDILSQVNAQLNTMGTTAPEVIKGIGGSFADTTTEVEKQTEALERLNYAWLEIDKKRNVTNFDSLGQKKISGTGKFNLPSGAPKFMPDLNMDKFLSYSDTVNRELQKELANTAFMQLLVGDSFDTAGAQLEVYMNAAQKMGEIFKPGEKELDVLIAKIRELQETIKNQEAWTVISEQVQAYAHVAKNMIDAVSKSFEAAKNHELKIAGKNTRERQRIEEQYAKRMKALGIIEAIINTAVGVTKALSTAPPLSFILAAATAAAGGAEVALIASQPLAEGGVIPPGYPNDTYPARLTSGETVVPPGKLDNLTKDNFGKVVFEIEGSVLRGILQKVDRTSKSFA